jgi:hypothetical protein
MLLWAENLAGLYLVLLLYELHFLLLPHITSKCNRHTAMFHSLLVSHTEENLDLL